jgi:hypothetical protein
VQRRERRRAGAVSIAVRRICITAQLRIFAIIERVKHQESGADIALIRLKHG